MSEEIKHYGVLGMKWGVRKDGRPQGYGNPGYRGPKKQKSKDHLESRVISKKKPSEMSNQELKTFNERRRLEQEYARLTKKGSTNAKRVLTNAANQNLKSLLKADRSSLVESLKGWGIDDAVDIADMILDGAGEVLVDLVIPYQKSKK